MTRRIQRIVSGGQTGADRGGLDAAIAAGVAHGGWCPRGRRAEDGVIPAKYQLQETASADYVERTRYNVRDSDATIIFVAQMTPGSRLTVQTCLGAHAPYYIMANTVSRGETAGLANLLAWLDKTNPTVLNVAGSRESRTPGIAGAVERIVTRLLRGAPHGAV